MVSALTLSDDSFLRLFNFEQSALLEEKDDIADAKKKLLQHYGNRVAVGWPQPPETITDLDIDIANLDRNELISKADAILDNQISSEEVEPIINSDGFIEWQSSPVSNPEWLWWLHRHSWWAILAHAYLITTDERYAGAFVSQMVDWIGKNPPPQEKDERSPSWRLMETGLRLRISWIPAFGIFYNSVAFEDEFKLIMLRSIFDQARFLSLFKSRKNHLLRESNGLAYAGIYFPEFKEAELWQQIAFERFDNELESQINADGSQIEVSIGYQWLVTDEFETAFEVLESNNLRLSKSNLKLWLEKMYNVLAYTIRPDATFPQINDGFIQWPYTRLAKAGKIFNRQDFTFIGTAGIEGEIPSKTSIAFGNAGWYIMRSNWSPQAKYLLFDAGPYGGHHGHEDKLSLEVFAFGLPFIVDCGTYSYERTDPFRNYFVSSLSHNTVLVDGLSQIRRWQPEHMRPRPGEYSNALWQSQSAFDFVEATYSDGYGSFRLKKPKKSRIVKDVMHTRRVLFVKPDYWLIVDEIKAPTRHDYQLLFHAHPDIDISSTNDNTVVLSGGDNSACLLMKPLEPNTVELDLQIGTKNPIQGWYSVKPHLKYPSTTVIYERKSCAYAVMTTLLYPCASTQAGTHVGIEPLDVKGPKAVAVAVDTLRGRDILMVSLEKGLKSFDSYQSPANVFGVRLDLNGNLATQFEGDTL